MRLQFRLRPRRWSSAVRRSLLAISSLLLLAAVLATATSTARSPSHSHTASPAWIAALGPRWTASPRVAASASSASCWRLRSERNARPRSIATAFAVRGGSGSQRRRRSGAGGGGGGKSYKLREKEKARGKQHQPTGSPLPFSSADEDRTTDGDMVAEGEANKPDNWPGKTLFGQRLKWPSTSLGGGNGIGITAKEAFRRRLLPGIRVQCIDDPTHLLRGQYGVYATREFNPFDIVGEYVGRVVPPETGGEYVATIDWEDRRFEGGAGMWGVDSGEYGNEIRMINHFNRIAPVPNVKLVTAYVNELPHILAVVIRPIRVGQELLLDYGPNYWCGKLHAAPPEPPGIDDPPERMGEEEGLLDLEGGV